MYVLMYVSKHNGWLLNSFFCTHIYIHTTQSIEKEGGPVWNYVFAKDFHVSPFMGMDHTYDWDFSRPREKMWVITHMLRLGTER